MRFDLKSFQFADEGRAPDALAVAAADRSLTWSQLRTEAHAWADAARKHGVAPDVPVAIYGHKEAAFFVAMVGALLIGAPFVPVDTIYPPERLRQPYADGALAFPGWRGVDRSDQHQPALDRAGGYVEGKLRLDLSVEIQLIGVQTDVRRHVHDWAWLYALRDLDIRR